MEMDWQLYRVEYYQEVEDVLVRNTKADSVMELHSKEQPIPVTSETSIGLVGSNSFVFTEDSCLAYFEVEVVNTVTDNIHIGVTSTQD